MPALSERDDREEEAVLAVVARLKSCFADDVGEGVNAERSVIKEGSADAESPGEHLKWGCSKLWKVRLEEVA